MNTLHIIIVIVLSINVKYPTYYILLLLLFYGLECMLIWDDVRYIVVRLIAQLLGNESKKQRDQCGSSTQYTRVAYNGERGLALSLMPLFICVN